MQVGKKNDDCDYKLLPVIGCDTECVSVKRCVNVAISVWGIYKSLAKYIWVCKRECGLL